MGSGPQLNLSVFMLKLSPDQSQNEEYGPYSSENESCMSDSSNKVKIKRQCNQNNTHGKKTQFHALHLFYSVEENTEER
jgi:hypothetical protein